MQSVEKYLLAQRKDGKFLRLDKQHLTTAYDYVDEPELAERIKPFNQEEIEEPKPATHYFENSWRARELWLKDCKMVPYEIRTDIIAKPLNSKGVKHE